MQEGYLVSASPETGDSIDEFETFGLEPGESFGEIGNPEGKVMKARSSPLQEAAHGAVGAKRFQELNGSDEADPDTLSGNFFGGGTGLPGQGFIKTTGLLQGGDGHGDVVQRIRKHVFFRCPGEDEKDSRKRLNPAAWYPEPPKWTRSRFDGGKRFGT
jgi:hypothetical protein